MSTRPTSGPAMHAQRLTYEDWTHLLCDHFFRAEYDGVPVMLFVDDDAVVKVYGGEPREAVASLVSAVSGRLDRGRPRQLFGRIESEARRWRIAGGDGPPPSLPLLALAVLAATRMGHARDRAGHNYYTPFCELLDLDIDRELIIESYRDAMPYLWQTLQWWLDGKHRGRLGFSTIVEDDHFTYIGYADSQTLFSSSDRDKLTQFFQWIRLRPGEQMDQAELMTYFRSWAASREDISEGTAYMLDSEEHTAQLAQIIKAAADRWRGAVREDGRRVAEIVVALELFPHPRLELVAERPEGLPAELECQGSLRSVTLVSSCDGWYDASPIPLSSAVLDFGLRLVGGNVQFRLPPYGVHVLEKSAELGMWASVSQLSPGEPAWLLVRRSSLDAVSAYLGQNARSDWRVVERKSLAPRGWCLVGEVMVEAAGDQAVPEAISRIVPRVQNRFSLKGGLRLPRGSDTYLTGGEPDVWLPPPPAGESGFELQLDDREPFELPRSATRMRLATEGLEAGGHAIKTQGISRTFSTIRSLGRIIPSPGRTIAHALKRVDEEMRASAPSARSIGDEQRAPREVRIAGALVEDPNGVLGDRPQPPLVLPTHALRRVLIGARPGEIADIAAPTEPPWMRRAGLTLRVFEVVPRFAVAWIITEWHLDPVRARLKHPLGPLEPDPSASTQDLAAWADAVRRIPQPEERTAFSLWNVYLEAAEALA